MRSSKQDPDREWVGASRQGDSQAFGRLVELHQKGVYGLALRLTRRPEVAEDLTQETFLTAWQKLSSFKETGPFRAWLFRIALNKFRSYWRWKRLRNWLSLESLEREKGGKIDDSLDVSSRELDPGSVAEDPNLQKAIQAALLMLSSRQREVIVLRAQGLEIHEIASVLCIAEGTTKAHLFEAKRRLQEKLKAFL